MNDQPPRDGSAAMESHPDPLPPARPGIVRRISLLLSRVRALRERIERARVHSGPLDAGLETIERDSEIGGPILAGAVAYRLFVFALPLAFLLVSVLGLLARAFDFDPLATGDAVGLAGLVTEEVANAADDPSTIWVVLGSLVAVAYVTRVLLRALAIVHALAWERSAAAVTVSQRSFGVLCAAVLGQLVLIAGVGAIREQTPAGGVAVLVLAWLAAAALWLAVSLELPRSTAGWRDLVPGALLYGVGTLGVQVFSVYMLDRVLESKSGTYGTLGTAAAVLLALFLIGRVIVVAAVLNATLYERRARFAREKV